jgi:steroid delta-isomerase-like uncharacterized protein
MFDKKTNVAAQESLGEIINSKQFDRLGEVFSDDVIDHDPAPDQGLGVAGFQTFFSTINAAFPDFQLAVDSMVADDDQVAIAYRLTGTHEGDFQGIAPTGKRIEARAAQVARFSDGKIVERWGSTDELGIVRQLGAQPTP